MVALVMSVVEVQQNGDIGRDLLSPWGAEC